jgi:ssDNA-binding Zn-finger/Zn-ribbon topoisomerase 1
MKELKELLKPPFRMIENGGYIVSNDGQIVVLEVLPLSYNLPDKSRQAAFEQFQDEVTDYVVAALNNQYERDYGEKLRWVKFVGGAGEGVTYDAYQCPYCKKEWSLDDSSNDEDKYCFCPSCGGPLDPPENGDGT